MEREYEHDQFKLRQEKRFEERIVKAIAAQDTVLSRSATEQWLEIRK